MVPAVRVIKPGPRTSFPIYYFSSTGERLLVTNLEESSTLERKLSGGYFTEAFEDERESLWEVDRFCARFTGGKRPWDDSSAENLALRAAYVLWANSAVVRILETPKGLLVSDVDNSRAVKVAVENLQIPCDICKLKSMAVEWVVVDSLTGMEIRRIATVPAFQTPHIGSGESALAQPLHGDIPLSLRLEFEGRPGPELIHCLDLAFLPLAAIIFDQSDIRRRAYLGEGTLGAFERSGQGFTYFGFPATCDGGVLKTVAAIASFCVEHQGEILSAPGIWPVGPEDALDFARACYLGDREWCLNFGERLAGLMSRVGERETADALRDLLVRQVSMSSTAFAPAALCRAYPDVCVHPSSGADVVVNTGSAECRAHILDTEGFFRVGLSANSETAIMPNEALASKLNVLPRRWYQAYAREKLLLGPFLGILSKPRAGARRFGVEQDRFRRLIEISEDAGILAFVLEPSELCARRAAVTGWSFSKETGWFRARFPVPHVIYDRLIGETREFLTELYRIRDDISFINSLEFTLGCQDKYLTFKVLSAHPEIRPYLPDTLEIGDPREFLRYVRDKGNVYLKPRYGSRSLGLIHVARDQSRGWMIEVQEEYGVVHRNSVSDDDLMRLFDEKACSTREDYIVQEGICYSGQIPAEIRVIMQKGGRTKWMRTGMTMRVGAPEAGFIVPLREKHERVSVFLSGSRVLDVVRDLSGKVVRAVENSTGPGGEVSVDIILDGRMHPYVIEVNSKPASLFRDTGAYVLRDLSIVRLVNYAKEIFLRRLGVAQ